MAIVDINGNPFDQSILKTQQTAASFILHRTFDTHPSRGLTPAKLAAIMQQAEMGYMIAQANLFKDMEEKDGHIFSEMHKRKMAVAQLDWRLAMPKDASSRELKSAHNLESWLRDKIDFEDLIFDALDAIGHGYSCLELEWQVDAQGRRWPKLYHRDPAWFTCPLENRNTLHLRDPSNLHGVPLTPFGWIPHIHKAKSGYLARAGIHRVLAWPYLYKNYSVRDLAEFLEIYGLPIRLGKYPNNASNLEKNTLMQAVMSIGHNAAGIVPEGMSIDFVTATSAGSGDPFKAMIDWCERTQSKAILGGTLTSETGAVGSHALGNVHNDVRLDIRNSDARQLSTTLRDYLIYPICVLSGIFEPERVPRLAFDTVEPEDMSVFSDAIPKLVGAGARIPVRYINEKLKIPEPEEGEPILGMKAVVASTSDQTAAAKAGIAALSQPENAPDPTPITAYTAQLASNMQQPLADWLDILRSKVEGAESLEALRDDLLASYGDLPSETMTKIMATAFASADLAGRFDVRQGD